MKKTTTTVVLLFAALSFLSSQNIQLHRDFRHSLDSSNPIERDFMVATFEMFRPDRLGSTFFFVDFDFKGERGNLSGVYTEIARAFRIGDFPIMPQIEFNGGVGFGYVVENAYLIGANYPFSWGNFKFNTILSYRFTNYSRASHDAQLTFVWIGSIINDRITISGFADLWSSNRRGEGESGKQLVFYAEPQFWYNITNRFAVGTELRVSKNFEHFTSNFRAYPTLGVKYSF